MHVGRGPVVRADDQGDDDPVRRRPGRQHAVGAVQVATPRRPAEPRQGDRRLVTPLAISAAGAAGRPAPVVLAAP